jgi:predicted short-subunit dehydrogenase-like oxidoreductase (DUF2520 family)
VLDASEWAFALVGPGRAGTTLAVALSRSGARAVAVAGRSPDAPSVRRAAELLGVPAAPVGDAARDVDLVLLGVPDAAIAETGLAVAPGLRPGALVLHLSGACTLDELHKLHVARPDVRVGSLHPLQSLPSVEVGIDRLPGSWCAVDGPAVVEELATLVGLRPFRVGSDRRATYHAAATIASNHLVALLGQAYRVADAAGVPAKALLPLVRATLDNVDELGPERALTGPVARGDVDTVRRHLDALPDDERAAYRAVAEQARRLARADDDEAMRQALEADR